MAKRTLSPPRKKYTRFRPAIRSRHPSHDILREALPLLPFKSVIRLGSDTELEDTVENGGNRVEINPVDGINNSKDKLAMKQRFVEAGVNTADWVKLADWNNQFEYPIVVKHRFGSRGTGNTLLHSKEEFAAWIKGKTNNHYIVERFYTYVREYRLHVTADGCFYTNRKMLKEDAPKETSWQRHDDNCIWVLETNEKFDKPACWDTIISDCVKALAAVGLDVGAFDVKVQSARNSKTNLRKEVKFIIIEVNSAPSFGLLTAELYVDILPKLLVKKYNNGRTR